MRRLSETEVARLEALSLTYDEVGASLGKDLPEGYRHIDRTRELPDGLDFERLRRELLGWGIQEGAGLGVAASGPVEEGAVVEVRIGRGPLGVTARCRVVEVVDEPCRVGFAYGTLVGHPERGEESFLLERDTDGRRSLTVRAFSRPATSLARLGGPLSRGVQDFITGRYLRALD